MHITFKEMANVPDDKTRSVFPGIIKKVLTFRKAQKVENVDQICMFDALQVSQCVPLNVK